MTNVKNEVLCVGIPGFTYISRGPLQIDKIVYNVTEGNTKYNVYSKLVLTDDQKIASESVTAAQTLYSSHQKSEAYGYFYDYVTDLNNGSFKHTISPVWSDVNTQLSVTISDDDEGSIIDAHEGVQTKSMTAQTASANKNNCFGFIYIGEAWDVDLKITFDLYSYVNVEQQQVSFGTGREGQNTSTDVGSFVYLDSWVTYYNPAVVNKNLQFELQSAQLISHSVPNGDISLTVTNDFNPKDDKSSDPITLSSKLDDKPLSKDLNTYIPSCWKYDQNKQWCRSGDKNFAGSYSLKAAEETTVLRWHNANGSSNSAFMLVSIMDGTKSGRNLASNSCKWYKDRKFTGFFGGFKNNDGTHKDIIYPVYRSSTEYNTTNNGFMIFLTGQVETGANQNLITKSSATLSNDRTGSGWDYLFSSYPFISLQSNGNTPIISTYVKTYWNEIQQYADGKTGGNYWTEQQYPAINPLTFGAYMSKEPSLSRYLQIPYPKNDSSQKNDTLKKAILDEWQNQTQLSLQLKETVTDFKGKHITNTIGSNPDNGKNITTSYNSPNYWYPFVQTTSKEVVKDQAYLDSKLTDYTAKDLYGQPADTDSWTLKFSNSKSQKYSSKWAIQGYAFSKDTLAKSNSLYFNTKPVKLYLGDTERKFSVCVQAAPGRISAIDSVNGSRQFTSSDEGNSIYLKVSQTKYTRDPENERLSFKSTDRKFIPYIYSNASYNSGINAALSNGSIKSININLSGTNASSIKVGKNEIKKDTELDFTSLNPSAKPLQYYCISGGTFIVDLPLPDVKNPSYTYIVKINAFAVGADLAGNNKISIPSFFLKGESLCNGMFLVHTKEQKLSSLTFTYTYTTSMKVYIESICAFALNENWYGTSGSPWPKTETTDTVYTADSNELKKVVMPFMFCAAENIHLYTKSSKKKYLTGAYIPSDLSSYIIVGFYQLSRSSTSVKDIIWATNVDNGKDALMKYISGKTVRNIPTQLVEPTDDFIKKVKNPLQFDRPGSLIDSINKGLIGDKQDEMVSGGLVGNVGLF